MAELTDKQELFCNQYLIDLNATQAAIRAGYSEDTARSIGSENLTKPDIQKRINELRQADAERLNITRERILQEYSKLAFFDVRKIHTPDGAIMPVNLMDDDSAAAIAGIEVYEENSTDDEGERMTVGQVKKIKLSDKRAALDSLCKVLGYNAADKLDVTSKGEQIQGFNYIPPNDSNTV